MVLGVSGYKFRALNSPNIPSANRVPDLVRRVGSACPLKLLTGEAR